MQDLDARNVSTPQDIFVLVLTVELNVILKHETFKKYRYHNDYEEPEIPEEPEVENA